MPDHLQWCCPAEEAGTESHSLGTSTTTKPGQTAGGARNAAQRRNRAFRHALVRPLLRLHLLSGLPAVSKLPLPPAMPRAALPPHQCP